MPRCSTCGRTLTGRRHVCPVCAPPREDQAGWDPEGAWQAHSEQGTAEADGPAPSDEPLTAVARFRNAAEAGYFAHELTRREGLQTTLSIDESFDALSGCWSVRFILSVPQSQSETAVQALSDLIHETGGDGSDEPYAEQRLAPGREPDATIENDWSDAAEDSGVNWVPIVLTLAAGSAVLWATRPAEEPPKREPRAVPAGRQHFDLWDHLGSSPGLWIQQHENGRGRRELQINALRGTAVLREDANGDGRFEKEIRIRRDDL